LGMGMPGESRMPLMKNDFGGWAQHYASIPYDHYKVEIYQLFIDIFVHMKSHTRVLDVGSGPAIYHTNTSSVTVKVLATLSCWTQAESC